MQTYKLDSITSCANLQKITVSLFLFAYLLICRFVYSEVHAQSAISLSVSPPLFEAVVMPSKEVKQIYTVTNNGGDTIITPKILYFETENDFGNVVLTEDEAPEWVRYDKEPFSLKYQENKQFTVLISPPEDAEEIDHFLTLVFESTAPTDILGQNAVFYKSQIGTNILLSISKDGNPKKSAKIIEFTAPFIIDSIYPISYNLTLSNNGNSFWKPNGKIIINNQKNLNLAPQNVLSGNSRKLNCINDEILSECTFKGSLLAGKYQADLEFTIDEDPKIYKQSATTYVFPFTYLGIGILLLTTYKIRGILKVWRKGK